MSTDPHRTQPSGALPEHDTVAFEARDVKARTIYVYLAVLAVAVILSYAVCVWVLRATTSMARQSDTPPPPVRKMMGDDYVAMPPEPRLQGVPGHNTDPQQDLREKLAADRAENEKAGWIDQNTGVAQIPVKDAMKMIVEKGLPAIAAPASDKKKK